MTILLSLSRHVSWWHADVYKRQVFYLYSMNCLIKKKALWCSGFFYICLLYTSGTFFSLKDIRSQLVADIKAKARRDADDPETPAMLPISKDEIHRAFAKPGVVSQMYDKFETRSEQVSMSVEVRNEMCIRDRFKLYKSTVLKREVGLLLSVLLAVTLFIREDTIPFRKGTHRRKYVGLDC